MNQQKLIEDNLNLVYDVINRYYPNCSKDEDIIQWGRVGLCKAAKRWDDSKSAFSTFAYKCITNEIKQEFRRRCRHPITLSLEYEVSSKDGDTTTFGDLIIGDEDVDYVDWDFISNNLSDKSKEIFDLLIEGNTSKEISNIIGSSVSCVNWHIRRIKKLLSDERTLLDEEGI